jgi:hypothetical protein
LASKSSSSLAVRLSQSTQTTFLAKHFALPTNDPDTMELIAQLTADGMSWKVELFEHEGLFVWIG